MKPEDLVRSCVLAIWTSPEAPRAARVVLAGKLPVYGWPQGRRAGEDSGGRKLYSYPATKALARCVSVWQSDKFRYRSRRQGKGLGEQVLGEITILRTNEKFMLDRKAHSAVMTAVFAYDTHTNHQVENLVRDLKNVELTKGGVAHVENAHSQGSGRASDPVRRLQRTGGLPLLPEDASTRKRTASSKEAR